MTTIVMVATTDAKVRLLSMFAPCLAESSFDEVGPFQALRTVRVDPRSRVRPFTVSSIAPIALTLGWILDGALEHTATARGRGRSEVEVSRRAREESGYGGKKW